MDNSESPKRVRLARSHVESAFANVAPRLGVTNFEVGKADTVTAGSVYIESLPGGLFRPVKVSSTGNSPVFPKLSPLGAADFINAMNALDACLPTAS